jgi:hypothetical protein
MILFHVGGSHVIIKKFGSSDYRGLIFHEVVMPRIDGARTIVHTHADEIYETGKMIMER